MEAALRLLIPKICGGVEFEIYQHNGKSRLLNSLSGRLRGYAAWWDTSPWHRDHCRIIVLVDRDSEDCHQLKYQLEAAAAGAGLPTRQTNRNGYIVATRVAVEELEAWYFGDWKAVKSAYPRVPATTPQQAAYRNPDAIPGGTWEALRKILERAGHVWPGKIEVARQIAAHMVPERNDSASFCCFRDLLREICSQ